LTDISGELDGVQKGGSSTLFSVEITSYHARGHYE
jgi:hypothetical protein